MKIKLLFIPLLLIPVYCRAQDTPIYKAKTFTVYPDRVVQGSNKTTALSATALTSAYRSTALAFKSPVIEFKFRINGKDNEMPAGRMHRFACIAPDGKNETTVIRFGQRSVDPRPVPPKTYLQPCSTLKIRLDMREVLEAFKKHGYYLCFNGDKIDQDEFKGVSVTVDHREQALQDPDGGSIYETTLSIGPNVERLASSWKLRKDISAFPQYHSAYKLSDALYSMSLEEMQKAIEPDSTFRTGTEWGGVWTRDISYSIILSMAILQPKVAIYSLMRKVKDGRVIQDTGTGGAYPVSSDRMIWAVAAWEVYKVTGDQNWLAKAYQIVKNSVTDDEKNSYDPVTGLVHGESSFLDWREQSYPRWMQPADIYESECLGTNVVHYQANKVLAQMARLMNDRDAAKYERQAGTIRAGIQAYLWQPAKGYYGQYLYGRNYLSRSPRSEALGEALAVCFGIADRERGQSVIAGTPVGEFGISCIYPQIPGIPPYHNNAIWPFVEAYWAIASARAGNEASVTRAIAAIYRSAGFWLTNKENFVAADGDYAGTQVNSGNMLWSLSGNIALVYKVLFGITYDEDHLQFRPFVPRALAGERTLNNFNYRGATLNIRMNGYGNQVKSITLDGKTIADGMISADLTGSHQVTILLADRRASGTVNQLPDNTAPETPVVNDHQGQLVWSPIKNALSYRVLKNGRYWSTVKATSKLVAASGYAEYQVAAVDGKGLCSFYSEPVAILPPGAVQTIQAEDFAALADLPYKGYAGKGFVEISKTINTVLRIPVDIPKAGVYAISFKYANGNGPVNTENKCAIRTLQVDGAFAGTIVLPQRGTAEWSNWGYSNAVQVKLLTGKHLMSLQFEVANENMNGAINQAMVDCMQVVKLK